mgnify:CR=1 FL=1
MKVKIIKKTIKEGDNYVIKSLYVCVDNKDDANKLAILAFGVGATQEQIPTIIRKSDRDENEFAFGLNCSGFTFDRVDRFGIMDCEIEYTKNAKGYISAKIKVVDKKEQVYSYLSPEDEVTGWSTQAPEPMGDGSKGEPATIAEPFSNSLDPNAVNDLPFN